MPKSRREAGFLAILGIVLIAIGASVGESSGKTLFLILGAVAFVAGAILWLIHYSNDLRKEKS